MRNLEIPLSVKYYTITFAIPDDVHSQSHIQYLGEKQKEMILKGETKKKIVTRVLCFQKVYRLKS